VQNYRAKINFREGFIAAIHQSYWVITNLWGVKVASSTSCEATSVAVELKDWVELHPTLTKISARKTRRKDIWTGNISFPYQNLERSPGVVLSIDYQLLL